MAGTRPSAPMPSETPAPVPPPAPVGERFAPSHPTVASEPIYELPLNTCGTCPGWKRQNPRFPFGQCLPAIRALGSPMYTPDLASCSLPPEIKAKGSQQ